MDPRGMLIQLVTLFLMMAVGYLCGRTGVIDPSFRRRLSSFILLVASPCIILSSVLSGSAGVSMSSALLCAFLYFGIMITLSALLVRLLRIPTPQRGPEQLMLIFTNMAFMGIPIIDSLYGASGVTMLSMFILVFNLLFFSYGVLLINRQAGINPRDLLSPGILSAISALFFGLTGLHLPLPVENALAGIGAVNTPIAMIIIGASLAHSDLRAALCHLRIYRTALTRLLLMPFGMLLLMRLLPIDRTLAGICVVLSAMPVAGNCGMLSDRFTPDDPSVSQTIILSTLLCALTLPLFSLLLTLL